MFDTRYPSQSVRGRIVAEIPYKGTEGSLLYTSIFLLDFNFSSFHGNLYALCLSLSEKRLTNRNVSNKEIVLISIL